jgi:hypothetical protein
MDIVTSAPYLLLVTDWTKWLRIWCLNSRCPQPSFGYSLSASISRLKNDDPRRKDELLVLCLPFTQMG